MVVNKDFAEGHKFKIFYTYWQNNITWVIETCNLLVLRKEFCGRFSCNFTHFIAQIVSVATGRRFKKEQFVK